MKASDNDCAIAVIGMSGRFPGARNIQELWKLLKEGKEALTPLSDSQLRAAGMGDALIQHPRFVKACMKLEGIDQFDAEFFRYSPRQAASLDPQQRLFLECAWEALESAACCPDTFPGSIGVFGGSSPSTYLFANIRRISQQNAAEDMLQLLIDSDKDFLTTRVSYKFGLRGPSVAIQTACSTSLVAVHFAVQSLLNFECDVALAGGAGARHAQETGYLYVEGGITSPDGHCRAFDADAAGMIAGNGIAVLVLKRLSDAIRDRDHVHAVILGSAINNDGAQKAGFTAPAVRGQAEVISTALAVAGVEPREVGMIEAHGTATPLGDSIELTALADVFRAKTSDARFCAIGSIKTNIGHLDGAAGAAGLVKAILCAEHKALVPSLHCARPNALLQSPTTPFFVNTRYQPWHVPPDGRRIAGVNSFGIGGTNAHVIVAEAPELPASEPSVNAQIVPLSARSATALDAMSANLACYLRSHSDVSTADVAYTLQVGRKRFARRRFVVADAAESLASALERSDEPAVESMRGDEADRAVVFMFPGQGVQCAGALSRLYETEPSLRDDVDRCAQALKPLIDCDIRSILCADVAQASAKIESPTLLQPSLFVTEYCLARLWMRWGIRPVALIGHSLGELAAACIAGVMELEDALRLVARRGQIVESLPAGSMLAVPLDEAQVRARLPAGISIAAVNGPRQCVVSGPSERIEAFAAELDADGTGGRRLTVTHAFHSEMMDAGVQALLDAGKGLSFRAPTIPFVSCVTGELVATDSPINARYWADHLRRTVQFAKGIAKVARSQSRILLEVGPGQSLVRLAQQQLGREPGVVFETPCEGAQPRSRGDLLHALGRMWARGAQVDWERMHEGEPCRRLSLPTYPFERQRHWLDGLSSSGQPVVRVNPQNTRPPPERWFYQPSWKVALNPPPVDAAAVLEQPWIVFAGQHILGDLVVRELRRCGAEVIAIHTGAHYEELSADSFVIEPDSPEDYRRLASRLRAAGTPVCRVVHCWSLDAPGATRPDDVLANIHSSGYLGLVHLLQAVCERDEARGFSLFVVTNGLYDIGGEVQEQPGKAALSAVCNVAVQELQSMRCCLLDVPAGGDGGSAEACEKYAAWIVADASKAHFAFPIATWPIATWPIAYRRDRKFIQNFEPVDLQSIGAPVRTLHHHGTYVLTGGTGKLALAIAERLVRTCQARLVLITRHAFPERERWSEIAASAHEDANAECVRRLLRMESSGASVRVITADVTDAVALGRLLEDAEAHFGCIRGVFHMAGDPGHSSASTQLLELSREDFEIQLKPKAVGFAALIQALGARRLDFGVSFSSSASILGAPGGAAHAAASSYLDHVPAAASRAGHGHWITVNWDSWHDTGSDPNALRFEEGLDALWSIISFSTVHHLVVSAMPLEERVSARLRKRASVRHAVVAQEMTSAPRSQLESTIVGVWEEALGVSGIGAEDDFLALGGDSLIGVRVLSKLRDAFGVSVSVRQLITSPATVGRLAAEIEAALGKARSGTAV